MGEEVEERIWVFVYGALMRGTEELFGGLAARVDDHGVRFVVPGIRLLEPSFAALVPEEGAVAHGVVFQTCLTAWHRAIAHEVGYEETQCRVHTPNGVVTARTLVMAAGDILSSERRPSARYAQLLAEGAAKHGLPETVQAQYRRLVETGPTLSLRLLVFEASVRALIPLVGFQAAVAIVLGAVMTLLTLAVWLGGSLL